MDLTTFLAGLGIGALIGWAGQLLYARKLGTDQRLGDQLAELKQSHQDYQIKVSEHFEQTSTLIEQLNDSYQAVNLHLTQGIEQLSTQDHRLTNIRSNESDLTLDPPDTDADSKPRDYADKPPGSVGTLSSHYSPQ